ncbi:MAG: hypothetical protein HC918_03420 [Oscillatoriales cyanobacterium SM2_1_8]|nr:hypothetical protein [Oscillatoriales cyanobacterium SM2_1_8]
MQAVARRLTVGQTQLFFNQLGGNQFVVGKAFQQLRDRKFHRAVHCKEQKKSNNRQAKPDPSLTKPAPKTIG